MSRRLGKQAWLLLSVFLLFSFSSLLSGTFLPIYLWRQLESPLTIGLYILAQYVSSGLVVYVAGATAKRGNKRRLIQLGAASSAFFYAVILLCGEQAVHYVLLLGLLYGIGLAFFWLAYNVFYFEITDVSNRDAYNGWQGILVALSGIVAPWLASQFIVWFGSGTGYQIIFICSFSLYGLIVLVSMRLEKRIPSGVYEWKYPISMVFGRVASLRHLSSALIYQGIREGLFFTLLPFFVFLTTKNEAQIGIFTLVTSLIAVTSNAFVSKWLQPQKRKSMMFVGAIISWLSIFFIFLFEGFTGLLLFGSLTAIIWPLFIITFTTSVFNQIGKKQDTLEHKEEFIVFRELALTVGRIIGLIPFFIYGFFPDLVKISWILLLVGIAPVFAVLAIAKVNRQK